MRKRLRQANGLKSGDRLLSSKRSGPDFLMLAFDPSLVSLVSACTALMASVTGPLVTLYVARAQIRATVRSANRQKWIEEFRSTVSEFCGQIAATTQVREKVFKDGRVSVAEQPDLLRHFERLISTSVKIRLMINPLNHEHQKLVAMIDDVLSLFRTTEVSDDVQGRARAKALQLADISLAIIRYEWRRVQQGA